MSSATFKGSWSGPMIAETVTAMRRVAPKTAPAKRKGEGIQLFPVPWCSSVWTVSIPRSSAYFAISSAALYRAERVSGVPFGSTRLKRATVMGMEKSPFAGCGGRAKGDVS